MVTQWTRSSVSLALVFLMASLPLAQAQQDPAPLRNWPAPPYWQPNQSEEQANRSQAETSRAAIVALAGDVSTQAQTPANSLVVSSDWREVTPHIPDRRKGA